MESGGLNLKSEFVMTMATPAPISSILKTLYTVNYTVSMTHFFKKKRSSCLASAVQSWTRRSSGLECPNFQGLIVNDYLH